MNRINKFKFLSRRVQIARLLIKLKNKMATCGKGLSATHTTLRILEIHFFFTATIAYTRRENSPKN